MRRKDIYLGVLAALVLGFVLSPFASQSPDGLERVAEDKGFLVSAEGDPVMGAPIPDYAMPGIADERLATRLAGGAGVLIMFAVGSGAAFFLKRRKA